MEYGHGTRWVKSAQRSLERSFNTNYHYRSSFVMTVHFLAFAQLADQLGFRERVFECSPGETARTLLERVAPEIDLSRLRVAIDEEYRSWDEPLEGGNVVALIPPVSGG